MSLSIPSGNGAPNVPALASSSSSGAVLVNGNRCQTYKSDKTAASFCGSIWGRIKRFFCFGTAPRSMQVARKSHAEGDGFVKKSVSESTFYLSSRSPSRPAPCTSSETPPALSPEIRHCMRIFQNAVPKGMKISGEWAKHTWQNYEITYRDAYDKTKQAFLAVEGLLSGDAARAAHKAANAAAAEASGIYIVNEANPDFHVYLEATEEQKQELMTLKDLYRPLFGGFDGVRGISAAPRIGGVAMSPESKPLPAGPGPVGRSESEPGELRDLSLTSERAFTL